MVLIFAWLETLTKLAQTDILDYAHECQAKFARVIRPLSLRPCNGKNGAVTRDKNTWEHAKTVYAAGIGLRELARNMGIPEGTMLARASREGWTQQIATAKVAARPKLETEGVRAK